MSSPDILADLSARGLIQDTTDIEALRDRLAAGPIVVYAGFDPTAKSLHAGNLLALLTLRRFQLAGHRPIVVAGGATGMIGDPGGKASERSLLDDESLAANLAGVVPQLQQFLDFDAPTNAAKLLDNRAWTVHISFIEFLRDVGKHVSVNQMVAKESVKSRLEGDGISYTEFSYMLLQAHDFHQLHELEGCELQIGGSDQWGNIVSGVDLTRRKAGAQVHGLTFPLLTKPDGTKYGKTAEGDTMWLSADMMSPYRFHQSWMQVADGEVDRLLRQLTMLDLDEISKVVDAHDAAPHERAGQRRLAIEITALVHGQDQADAAELAGLAMFGGAVQDLSVDTFGIIGEEVGSSVIERDRLEDTDLIDVVASSPLAKSKADARRTIDQGGLYWNGERITEGHHIADGPYLHDRYALLRKGKRAYHLLVIDD